jgi:hypothetical protein
MLVCTTIDQQGGQNQQPQDALEFLMNGPPRWAKFQQSPTNSKARKNKKDQSDIMLLIYQSFGMSPIWVELTPWITRLIFPQLKNGLGLGFSALCGQTSLETSTDTRLPK